MPSSRTSPRAPAQAEGRADTALAPPALSRAAAGLGAGPWLSLSARARAAALADALRELAHTSGLCAAWSRALALPRGAAPPGYSAVRRRLARAAASGAVRVHRRPPEEPAWVVCETALGPGRTLALAVEELAAGRPVLAVVPELFAEPLWALEDYLLDALDAPDGDSPLTVVPAQSASPRAVFEAALAGRGAQPERFVAALAAPRAAELEACAVAQRGAAGPALDVAAEDGALAVHALRTAALVVGEHEDPAHAAQRVARLAFGAPVAGGFLADALGAVWVHPRRFAAFHSALLAALEGDPAGAPGVPVAPCAKLAEFRDAFFVTRRLGLDEGATLIHDPGHSSARSGPGHRAVFTNVEPGSRLARDLEPAATLRIQRVTSARPPAVPAAREAELTATSAGRRALEPYGWD